MSRLSLTAPPPLPDVDPQAWEDFKRYRIAKARGKAIAPQTWSLNAHKLAALTPEQQRAIVNLTIERGWTGLFPQYAKPAGGAHEARRHLPETAAERRQRINRETFARAGLPDPEGHR